MINDITKEYIYEINAIYEEAQNIADRVLDNQDLKNDVYKGAIIVMCIKFEACSVELYNYLFSQKEVIYNRTWFHIQEVIRKMGLIIEKTYKEAKAGWEFYNTLKHINKSTIHERARILEKYNIESKKAALDWIHTALVKLLSKFIIEQKLN